MLGITSLAEKIGINRVALPDRKYIKGSSFTIYDEINPLYVEPFFSVINGEPESHPKIVLISCAGAVGKSEMSKYISAKYHMPVLDLALHKAVGDSTMTGVLANEYKDLNAVKQELKDGKESILIDALDEGLLKVSLDGYCAFLDDIVGIVKATGSERCTPFIMTGRPTTVFETANYFQSKGINILWIQIEPFTIKEANEFIDRRSKYIYKLDLNQRYYDARKKLVESIECFFTSQNDARRISYSNFIGYAPVLIAISEMIGKTPNYQNIISRLEKTGYRNTSLLMEIIKSIMDRDKEQKIMPALVDVLTSGRDDDFKTQVAEKVYTYEEQCVRILGTVLGIDPEYTPVDDPAFMAKYQEKIAEFAKEHPFLDDDRISNVVFESFVLATVSASQEYSFLVEEYIRQPRFKNSFALFPIFAAMHAETDSGNTNTLPHYLIMDLSESFNSMISKGVSGNIRIEGFGDAETHNFEIEAEFTYVDEDKPDSKEEKTMKFSLGSDEYLSLGRGIKNAVIIGDFKVKAVGKRVTLEAPLTIDCEEFVLSSEELNVVNTSDGKVDITADKFSVRQDGNEYPKIRAQKDKLNIYTNSALPHPANTYLAEEKKEDLAYNTVFFNKIRRLLLNFCCDSKGQGNWAKFKNKIDLRFNDGIGKETLEIMLREGIIYPEKYLYKIDVEKLGQRMGIKYDHIRGCKPSAKMIEFMNEFYPPEK